MFSRDDCRRNLRWYILFRMSLDFMMWGPTWVLYMRDELGFSFTEIMLFDFFFQTAIVLLEVPTGMFADIIGRRWALRGGAFSLFLAMGMWGAGWNAWWWISIAWAFWAIAATLINGADASLVFETLRADGRGYEFGKVLGRISSLSMLGMVAASVLGGWMAEYGYRVPILVHTALLAFTVFAAFRLREPPRAERLVHATVRNIARSIRALLKRSHRFRYLLIYSALIQVVEIMAVVYQQPLLVSLGFPIKQLGVFYAGAILIASVGPIAMTWASDRFGIARTLGLGALGTTIACLGLFWLPGLTIVIPFLVLRFFADGVRPVTIEGMNRLADPDDRATVLSLRSICISSVAGPMEVLSGWWADRVPIRRVYLVCGALLPLFSVWLGWAWKRHPEPMPKDVQAVPPVPRLGGDPSLHSE